MGVNFFFRLPICKWNVAPYSMVGAGGAWDGDAKAYGNVGGGIEYRITDHIGIFVDSRFFLRRDRKCRQSSQRSAHGFLSLEAWLHWAYKAQQAFIDSHRASGNRFTRAGWLQRLGGRQRRRRSYGRNGDGGRAARKTSSITVARSLSVEQALATPTLCFFAAFC